MRTENFQDSVSPFPTNRRRPRIFAVSFAFICRLYPLRAFACGLDDILQLGPKLRYPIASMSEVAIDALRVDLTRLLLSARSCGPAKGRPETDQIAQTTSLFRRCKQNGQGDADNKFSGGGGRSVLDTAVDDAAAAPAAALASTAAISRRSPLPDEVARYALRADYSRRKHAEYTFLALESGR